MILNAIGVYPSQTQASNVTTTGTARICSWSKIPQDVSLIPSIQRQSSGCQGATKPIAAPRPETWNRVWSWSVTGSTATIDLVQADFELPCDCEELSAAAPLERPFIISDTR